ncbi:hypothetical protein [Agromyces italicus]|uniref:hypothetical protein n=1 Tax=Agromyces italicus TaxID=279572 RepID=UPI0003B5866B|nr:hypothetical protein [Agromyces italicus]
MHFAPRRRLVIAVLVVTLALLVLAGFGVYGLLVGPAPASRSAQGGTASASPLTPNESAPVGRPQAIAETSEPELFARAVARAVIGWDTRGASGTSEWAQVIVDVADPDQGAAVATDVRSALPAEELWRQLGDYGTRQWLEFDAVTVPSSWSTAVAQAAQGQIPPDAAAFTISGIRHREGTWNSETVRTDRPIAFTVFVTCPHEQPCMLLRISQLDHPLD